jgi:hypothetical protein
MLETRHLEIEELLALRDGEGSRFALEHVDRCDRCRVELERLYQVQARLRALRRFTPPRDLWPRVAAEVVRKRYRTRFAFGTAGLAAAAVLAGFLVFGGPAVEEGPVVPGRVVPDAWVAETGSGDLGPMIVRARELETILRDYVPAQQVLDAPTALALSVLEDRIELIDAALLEGRSQGVDRELLMNLWSERVNALETLVGLQLVDQRAVWR